MGIQMGIQRLKSAAHAAGYAMAVPVEYFEEEDQQRLLALEAPPADRPKYAPHKPPHDSVPLLLEYHSPGNWLHDWFDGWRSGNGGATA